MSELVAPIFPEKIALSIQDLFRATPLLLIGSGFSCGFGLPSMTELADQLVNNIGSRLSSRSASSLWVSVLPDVAANLEHGLSRIAIGDEGREELVMAVREETARFIAARTKSAERQILATGDVDSQPTVRLLKRLHQGASQNAECISVITTNYDTLLELFCDLAELPVDTGFEGLRRRKARTGQIFQTHYRRVLSSGPRSSKFDHRPCLNIRLMKPHGSINWQVIGGEPFEVLDELSDSPKSIVIPGPTKYEDTLVNVLFDNMRTAMNVAVSRASAMLCVGFGFNDAHLQGMIQSRLDARMPAAILVKSFTPSIVALLQRHPHVLGIQQHAAGAELHFQGSSTIASTPVWELGAFLSRFLE